MYETGSPDEEPVAVVIGFNLSPLTALRAIEPAHARCATCK
jgi:hypothetical protein